MHRPRLAPVDELIADARLVVVLEDIVDHTNVGRDLPIGGRAGRRCGSRHAALRRPAVPAQRAGEHGHRAAGAVDASAGLAAGRRHPARGGFELAALTLAEHSVSLADYVEHAPAKVALLLGTEGDGLSRAALRHADAAVTVPMEHGVDSLNVAAASAVALWALRNGRNRRADAAGVSHTPPSRKE